jgi:Carboxypeptidase regulatory-like domain
MHLRMRVLAVLAAIVVAWSLPAFAQEQTGAIQGTIKDASGAVLPGATVEARSPQVVGASTAVSDAQGMYRFPALPPGTYTISVTLQGFATSKSEAVLALGQLLTIDVALKVAAVSETVEVTGESPLIDVRQNASFATLQRDLIARIPRGRDFTSILAIAPGTQDESYAGGTQIDGASGSENRFIIDGMDTTAIRSGVSNKTFLVDFIQEVQVKSSGYNAEFGGATGGVINVLSKAGSNSYRGSAGTYYNGNALRGEVRPTWRINPWTDEGGTFPGDLEQVYGRDNDKWHNWNPVFDFGGPLMRDRLWYYAGFSQDRDDYSRTLKYIYSNPVGQTKTFDWYSQERYLNWNGTTQLSSNIRLRVSGANQWNKNRGSSPAFQYEGSTFQGFSGAEAILNGQSTSGGWTSATYYADPQKFVENYELTGDDYTNQMFAGNLDWVIRPTFFVNMTSGALTYNTTQPPEFAAQSPRIWYGVSNMTSLPGLIPDSVRHQSGWYNIDRSNSLTQRAYYQRLFTNLNTILYKPFYGQHTFKAGVRFERINHEENSGYQYPIFRIYWDRTRTTGDGRRMRGDYGYYVARTYGTFGEANSNNWSLWLQDSWTIKDRLTINAGVRTEREEVPSYSGGAGIKFGFADKIAPRLGFAYDVKGDGKWKAYGSFGWFYDMMKLSLPISSFGGNKWIDWYFTLDTHDLSQIRCTPETSSHSGNCGPGTLIESIDYRFNSSVADPRLADYFGGTPHNTIDPDIKPYKTDEFTFGLDRELNTTMSLGVRYVRKRLIHAIEDVGVKLLPSANNPNGIEVYFISNPGYGLTQVLNPDFPSFQTPRAQRDYDSVELRLQKRLAQHWSLNASYLWSRLNGNFSGLASSDETGRTDPNVSRYFDAPYMSWNAQGAPNLGPLYTDRPHQGKVQATYDFNFGTTVGLNAVFQSGMPVGALVSWQGYPVFISTRDSLGRTPFQQRYDLYAQHDIRLKGNHAVNLSVNIDNVFDLKTITDYNQTINRDTLSFDDATYFGGFDPWQLMQQEIGAGGDMRYNPLVVNADSSYNTRPYSYMGRRAFRFMVKYTF